MVKTKARGAVAQDVSRLVGDSKQLKSRAQAAVQKAKPQEKFSWKGIPAAERKNVRNVIAVTQGCSLAPLGAWRMIQEGRAERSKQAQAEAEKAKAKAEQQAQQWREIAQKEADEVIRRLAILRDFIKEMDDDRTAGDDKAAFAKAYLTETGIMLEKSLFVLGITGGMDSAHRGRREGWFVEFLK